MREIVLCLIHKFTRLPAERIEKCEVGSASAIKRRVGAALKALLFQTAASAGEMLISAVGKDVRRLLANAAGRRKTRKCEHN